MDYKMIDKTVFERINIKTAIGISTYDYVYHCGYSKHSNKEEYIWEHLISWNI